jgi:hypothetical protein
MSADPSRVAFVLEAMAPGGSRRRVDIVFLATGLEPGAAPQAREPGVGPRFIPVDQLSELELRPPVAGYLRGLFRQGARQYAPYLGNLWRPADSSGAGPRSRSPGSAELLTRDATQPVALALRVASFALVTAVFAIFVARCVEFRLGLIWAGRELNLLERGALAATRLGRAARRDAIADAAQASVASFSRHSAPAGYRGRAARAPLAASRPGGRHADVPGGGDRRAARRECRATGDGTSGVRDHRDRSQCRAEHRLSQAGGASGLHLITPAQPAC